MTLVETRQVAVLLGKVLKGPGSSLPCLTCVQVGSKLGLHPTSGKGDREEEHTPLPFIMDNCGSSTRHFCSCSISSYSCDPLGEQPQIQCSSDGQYRPQPLSLKRMASSEVGAESN